MGDVFPDAGSHFLDHGSRLSLRKPVLSQVGGEVEAEFQTSVFGLEFLRKKEKVRKRERTKNQTFLIFL